jgi:hypothetical protein
MKKNQTTKKDKDGNSVLGSDGKAIWIDVKPTRPDRNFMKCPKCSFVIFYKGVVGLSSDLV